MSDSFHVLPQYQPLVRLVGLDAEAVFTHPDIRVWRKLPDRENCTLDAEHDGQAIRLHIKRYPAPTTMAEDEVRAIELLRDAGIPSVPLVGWGKLADGRSFLITKDLSEHSDAEKLVRAGTPFESLLEPTADLAARLHAAGLHHRDLYLCHFFVREERPTDVHLIDIARVQRLGRFFAGRWVVKDLAQFVYSTTSLPVTDEQREQWLARYAAQRKVELSARLRRAIDRKVRWIAKHDAKLNRSQPTRNVSISTEGPA